jgi:hypothetical protein
VTDEGEEKVTIVGLSAAPAAAASPERGKEGRLSAGSRGAQTVWPARGGSNGQSMMLPQKDAGTSGIMV